MGAEGGRRRGARPALRGDGEEICAVNTTLHKRRSESRSVLTLAFPARGGRVVRSGINVEGRLTLALALMSRHLC